MCGIVGYWGDNFTPSVAKRMADRLVTRGPDDFGVWEASSVGLALAHRRLSILELSPAGAQPMQSPCGRFVIAFNGEIYNHVMLRSELHIEGHEYSWRGNSDTETLLAGLIYWGVEKCLRKLTGMFAFALWDNLENTLFLARDRIGEKPLYYGRSGEAFLFGSELKAFKEHPSWSGDVDRNVLMSFLRYGYVPTPLCIYQGIFKLPPAHYVVIKDRGHVVGHPLTYWCLANIAENGVTAVSRSPEELTSQLELLLLDSVRLQMASDVPFGAFLSGGIDSTTVTALMQAQSSRPVKTFTIGFQEATFDEAAFARRVANYLGTEHSELYVTPQEAMSVLPRLATIYDEPFSDVSQIPTFLLCQLARSKVTVCLSGDGGDELFCGYNRYLSGYDIWRRVHRLPVSHLHLLARLIDRIPIRALDSLQRLLPMRLQVSSLIDRLPKLSEAIKSQDGFSYYNSLVSHAKNPGSLVIGADEPDSPVAKYQDTILPSLREQMMLWDMLSYLPDDILTKVDRASMAVSLEARVPFLDHRVVEFAWRVPSEFKYRNGTGKWLLRQVLYRYVPKKLMDRPKMGFGVPIGDWLRGPLREWAETLLSEARIRHEGYLNPAPIRQMWIEHLKGHNNWQYQLWDVLMFQSWYEENAR